MIPKERVFNLLKLIKLDERKIFNNEELLNKINRLVGFDEGQTYCY